MEEQPGGAQKRVSLVPDQPTMTVAMLGMAVLAVVMYYAMSRSIEFLYYGTAYYCFVLPYALMWVHGVFSAKSVAGRWGLILYAAFTVCVLGWALYDMGRTRCGSTLAFFFLTAHFPAGGMLLYDLIRAVPYVVEKCRRRRNL